MKEYDDLTYGKGLISENELYFVLANGSRVFVKDGANAPLASGEAGRRAATEINGKTYKGYDSAAFFNDCFHTAEEIMHGKRLETKEGRPAEGVFSKVKATGSDFGHSDIRNIKAVKGSPLDDAADPGVGEAYVIVNTNWGSNDVDAYPYHAAAVVAADGKDRVTLEVFATNKDATDRKTKGDYRMYTVGSGRTFHSAWKTSFKNPTVTTVLEKKS